MYCIEACSIAILFYFSVGSLCFLKNWEKDKDNSSPEAGGLKFSKERGTIIIPSNGYYYVYSRLTFKRNPSISAIEAVLVQKQEIKHIIEKSRQISSRFSSVQSSSIHCTNSSFVHSSFVQRVVYLETGDELRVRMSDSGQIQFDEKYKRENFFGIFRLWMKAGKKSGFWLLILLPKMACILFYRDRSLIWGFAIAMVLGHIPRNRWFGWMISEVPTTPQIGSDRWLDRSLDWKRNGPTGLSSDRPIVRHL